MVESYKNRKAEAISQNPTNIFVVYRTAVFSLQNSFHLSSEDTWSSNRYYQRIRISVTKLISYKNAHASIKIIDLNKHILIIKDRIIFYKMYGLNNAKQHISLG